MILAVQISGVNSSNVDEAIEFIQTHVGMQVESIKLALTIPGFYFYSDKFNTFAWWLFSPSFSFTPIDIDEPFFINTMGRKLEVPVSKINGNFNYITLKASDFVLKSAVSLAENDVRKLIDSYINERWLLSVDSPDVLGGDFSNDFNFDFN